MKNKTKNFSFQLWSLYSTCWQITDFVTEFLISIKHMFLNAFFLQKNLPLSRNNQLLLGILSKIDTLSSFKNLIVFLRGILLDVFKITWPSVLPIGPFALYMIKARTFYKRQSRKLVSTLFARKKPFCLFFISLIWSLEWIAELLFSLKNSISLLSVT